MAVYRDRPERESSPYIDRLEREARLPVNPYPAGTYAHRELESFKRGELSWQQPDHIGNHP